MADLDATFSAFAAARGSSRCNSHRMDAGLVLPAYANPRDPADFVLVW